MVNNYLMIQNNVVTNICEWDGNTEEWQPPANATMLLQNQTPAMIWQAIYDGVTFVDWVLIEVIGAADIGFSWNGSVATTNEPKPQSPTPPADELQPSTTGTQTI